MKKQLLLLVMILLPLVASADPVEIDGIYYNLIPKAKQAEVARMPGDNTYSGNIVIPPSVLYEETEYMVVSIGERAFYSCSYLSTVTIPNTVTTIGAYAFQKCYNLTNVSLPNSLTTIRSAAFINCTSLASIEIPNSVIVLEQKAFWGCSSLTSFVIPNTVTSIGASTFEDCSGLTTITIPSSVTTINDYAFKGCVNLKSVHISDITAWCHINFGLNYASPLRYAKHLYLNGEEIKNLVIPTSVTCIGHEAFINCENLVSVTLPETITRIPVAFCGCTNLTSVFFPNTITHIDGSFEGCSSLKKIILPNSVLYVSGGSFSGCSALSSITIGSKIIEIGEKAFKKCVGLNDIYCYAEDVPNTGANAFIDSYIEYSTLHVPANSIDAYKAVEPWKNFGSIVALKEGDPSYTGITNIMNDKKDSQYYDLKGNKLEKPTKGINIINGKKVIVK